MRRLALTSWSVHPLLQPEHPGTDAALSLTDLPARMRDAGIGTLEICHFHFPSTEPAYLGELRAAIDDAGVELFSILIDAGDISQADDRQHASDMRMIEGWIDVAATLGTGAARVVAGDAPPDDEAALERAIASLARLAAYGRGRNVRVLTENFRALASTAANCNRILDELGGEIGLCADIGNFPSASRVAEFSEVVPRAESIHAKANYGAGGELDAGQLRECLDASLAARFDGPYTLVFDRPEDRWTGIARLKQVVAAYVQ
jgi:sugar phosphate isomerase/epimerase